MRTNLLISGIISLITGLGYVAIGRFENPVTLVLGSIVILAGIISLMYARLPIKELVNKKNSILAMSIILFPFNLVTSIILLIEYDSIRREYIRMLNQGEIQHISDSNVKQAVTKEAKKVDVLLKIGVAMVALAGIMIVTTSWQNITNVIKLVILVVIGGLFYGLHKFSEIKLKIRNTTMAYWLLSAISFILAVFLLGYSEMLGNWFSINGEGDAIFLAVLVLVSALMTYITYKKFSMNSFLYATYIGIVSAIALVISYIGKRPEVCVLTIEIILLIINSLPKSGKTEIKIVKKFSLVLTYIFSAIILAELGKIGNNASLQFNELSYIVSNAVIWVNVILQIVSLVALAIREKNDTINVLSSISSIVLASTAVSSILIGVDEICKLLVTRALFTAMAVIISFVVIKDKKVSNIVLSVLLPMVLLSMILEINVAVAVFVGIIALAMIIFGAIVKEYKTIYIEGVIFTVLNLIIQMWDLWGKLPIYIYLLFGGLLLIAIVTVREVKRSKNENVDENK